MSFILPVPSYNVTTLVVLILSLSLFTLKYLQNMTECLYFTLCTTNSFPKNPTSMSTKLSYLFQCSKVQQGVDILSHL